MDCRTARFLLDYHRPNNGELPPEEVAELDRHLAGCADCDAIGRAERRFDETVASAMSDMPVPDGLKDRLLSRVRERGVVLRRRLAWAVRGTVVAATLLSAVGLWWHYRVVPQPQLDLPKIAEGEREKYHPLAASTVENWFKANYKVTMTAPPLNYQYLVDYQPANVQGKQVPKLVFRRDEPSYVRASVYVVTQAQFNLDTLKTEDTNQFDTGDGPHLKIWQPSPEFAYVIFYDGNDLDSLMPTDVVR